MAPYVSVVGSVLDATETHAPDNLLNRGQEIAVAVDEAAPFARYRLRELPSRELPPW